MVQDLGFLQGFDGSTLLNGENWFVNSIIAVIILVLAHTLVMIFSRAFKWDDLERYSKSEILQAFSTAVLVIFIIFLVQQAEQLISQGVVNSSNMKAVINCQGSSLEAKDQKSMLEIVKCEVQQKALNLADLYDSVYSNSKSIFQDLSAYVSLLGFPVWQGSWDSEKFNEGENIRILNQMITNLLVGLNGIIVLVNYISKNMLTVYLPAGLILRSFHFTRGIGAFFISTALGFYFIFPTLFVLTDPGLQKIPTIPKPDNLNFAPSCYPTFSGVSSTFVSTNIIKDSVISNSKDAAKVVSQFYITMILHPFAVFAVTLMFIRYMMNMLSGDAYDIMRVVSRLI